jgi:hypothetical protein
MARKPADTLQLHSACSHMLQVNITSLSTKSHVESLGIIFPKFNTWLFSRWLFHTQISPGIQLHVSAIKKQNTLVEFSSVIAYCNSAWKLTGYFILISMQEYPENTGTWTVRSSVPYIKGPPKANLVIVSSSKTNKVFNESLVLVPQQVFCWAIHVSRLGNKSGNGVLFLLSVWH